MTATCKTDLTGLRFNNYLVKKFIPDSGKYSRFLCECDCGTLKEQYSFDLTSGNAKSCGCLNLKKISERCFKHGQSGNKNNKRTRTYRSWASMMDRCVWGGHKEMFKLYGAVGRTVCDRWHDFEKFYEDMGDRPEKTSLDRIDNNGNYEPSNCRWATRNQQALNTSRTIRLKINGEEVVLKEYAEKHNLPYKAIRARASRRGNDYVAAMKSIGYECDYV
jgi:hypothetical protein